MTRVLQTDESTALKPRTNEMRFYAPGVGDVLELDVSPQQGRTVLVRMIPGRRR
ncbi:MAG: hypothetical protein H0V07_09035 [Propionibacteriales bacterium]|nr:hypothetical protein [Propionibacteriales bacterium]